MRVRIKRESIVNIFPSSSSVQEEEEEEKKNRFFFLSPQYVFVIVATITSFLSRCQWTAKIRVHIKAFNLCLMEKQVPREYSGMESSFDLLHSLYDEKRIDDATCCTRTKTERKGPINSWRKPIPTPIISNASSSVMTRSRSKFDTVLFLTDLNERFATFQLDPTRMASGK